MTATLALLGRLLLIAAALYLLLAVLMYWQQERLLFPAPRGAAPELGRQPGFESLQLRTPEGLLLQGVLRHASVPVPAGLLLYFGGNGELAVSALADTRWPADWSVATVEYRGYGRSEGTPSETALFADALLVHDELVRRLALPPGRVIVVGRSLGSGVAVHLASRRPVGGVVLVTPYDSITEVAARVYPWLPVRLLIRHAFDSHRRAGDIRTPALFVLAGQDTLILRHHSERLLQAWGGPARRIELPTADHADVMEHEAFWQALRRFATRRAALRARAFPLRALRSCRPRCRRRRAPAASSCGGPAAKVG